MKFHFRTRQQCILLFTLICTSFLCDAQQLGKFDVTRGAEPFLLGSSLHTLDTSYQLRQVGKLDWNGRTEYTYRVDLAPAQSYIIGKIAFKTLMVTYSNDTLIRIEFSNMYPQSVYSDYYQRGRKELIELSKLFKAEWGGKDAAEKFTRFPDRRVTTRELRWVSGPASMLLFLSENRRKERGASLVSVSVELNAKEYAHKL